MSKKWLRESSKDAWYRLAKKEGYRSRASYKLQQINERHNVIKSGDRVVDLGAAPGGWSQVAVELTQSTPDAFTVVGIDLDAIEPLEGALFVRGDITLESAVQRVLDVQGGEADVVISDMSPNISGSYTTDHARSIYLCEAALAFAHRVLRPGGNFVVKVFEGDLFPGFLAKVRADFHVVHAFAPAASRDASSEVFVVGKGFRGAGRVDRSGPSYQRVRKAKVPAEEWKDGSPLPPSWNAPDKDPYDY